MNIEVLLSGKWARVVAVMVLVSLVVAPAALFVAVVAPGFFAAVDSIKLILVAIAIALPVFLVNCAVCVGVLQPWKVDASDEVERQQLRVIFWASVATVPSLYIPTAILFFGGSHSPRAGIVLIVVTQVLLAALAVGVVLPALNRARETARRVKAAADARAAEMERAVAANEQAMKGSSGSASDSGIP